MSNTSDAACMTGLRFACRAVRHRITELLDDNPLIQAMARLAEQGGEKNDG